MEIVKRFYKEEEGQGLVEYALIIGLISIVAIAALSAAGGSINSMFTSVSDKLGSAAETVNKNGTEAASHAQ